MTYQQPLLSEFYLIVICSFEHFVLWFKKGGEIPEVSPSVPKGISRWNYTLYGLKYPLVAHIRFFHKQHRQRMIIQLFFKFGAMLYLMIIHNLNLDS